LDDDRVAIVTGGGSGIGAATAKLLASHGLTVAIVSRNGDALERIVSEIASDGGTAFAVTADLADPEAPEAVVRSVLERTQRLDVIVNNAAAFALAPFDEADQAQFDRLIAVNVRAPFFLVQAALPALRLSTAAAVVNLSSAAGVMYRRGQAIYALTKAAIEHLTKQMAFELAPDGIRVNSIRPGPIDTPLHRAVENPEERLRQLGELTPLGRVGYPEEIARWIWHLVNAEEDWVTGTVISVDGGRVLGPPERA
jgi:NAD(P)-dependent dehydrogenase (short-subunit alcohol dehydrogenase family)